MYTWEFIILWNILFWGTYYFGMLYTQGNLLLWGTYYSGALYTHGNLLLLGAYYSEALNKIGNLLLWGIYYFGALHKLGNLVLYQGDIWKIWYMYTFQAGLGQILAVQHKFGLSMDTSWLS